VGARERQSAVQLATLVDAPPEGADWIYEIKYDGYRALARKRGPAVELVSRRGLRYAGLEALRARIAALPHGELTLDGELCALDAGGKPRFEALQTALSGHHDAITYFVFDVLELDGVDLRDRPLRDRKRILAKLVPSTGKGQLRRVIASSGGGAAFLESTRALGLEGMVAKRMDRPYRAGRSLDWQKIKTHGQQELVVVGYTAPEGTRRGLGALLLGVHDGGALRYAGRVGSGFDESTLVALSARLGALRVAAPTVIDPPRLQGATWVRPELVAEVRFGEWTRDGRLRHPVFLGLRRDKRASEVVREVVRATHPTRAKPAYECCRPPFASAETMRSARTAPSSPRPR